MWVLRTPLALFRRYHPRQERDGILGTSLAAAEHGCSLFWVPLSDGGIYAVNSKVVGDISEAAVIAALLKSGVNVLIPFGDRNRYDVVIEHNGIFQRVQIKTGCVRDRSIVYNTQSSTRVKGKRHEVGYAGQIELFAVYHREEDRVYMVPVALAAKGKASLRLGSKGGPGVGPRCLYAEDFVLRCVSSVQ